uniref:Uncharacterized protein n=1 Tax=Rhizophora mucronata TaxID=61149 RepID=A0A2P2QUW8_RHIMU
MVKVRLSCGAKT